MRSIRLLGLSLLMLVSFASHSQTVAEFLRQKKTQKKYLIQQIAALQVYLGYAKQGYEIAGTGLGMIRDITGGEFKLHELFITGLKKVSPAIANDLRIGEIISMQVEILRSFRGLSAGFSGDHLDYVLEVKAGIVADCLKDLEELYLVITSGKAEMHDDERLARLDRIYLEMLDKRAFTQDFFNKASMFLRMQKAEQKSIEQLRRYYE